MTAYSDYYRAVAARLNAVLGRGEGDAAARIVFEDIAGYDRNKLFTDGGREITDYMQTKIEGAVRRIEAGEPVQYAVGRARFMGMDLAVTPAVLIPRFETEGLVDEVVKLADGRSDLRVLDIGTGSGCIAIALTRALPFSLVEGIDISDEALAVARRNAVSLRAKVDFNKADALALTPPREPQYDIIVSNPPYVLESERAGMDARVSDYEPGSALFVPDSDPLRFYSAISRYASAALVGGGWLCYEVNSRFADTVARDMESAGLVRAQWRRDYRGNPRFVYAQKPF